MLKPCLICYRVTDDLDCQDGAADNQATLERFFKLLERYLTDGADKADVGFQTSKRFLFKTAVNHLGIYSCEDCSRLMEAFCELYHQMKSAELFLNWKLGTLRRIMFCAQRVPARINDFREIIRNFRVGSDGTEDEISADVTTDLILDFKRDLIEKCRRKLQTTFPKVALKNHLLKVKVESSSLLQDSEIISEPPEVAQYDRGVDIPATIKIENQSVFDDSPINIVKVEVDPADILFSEDGFQQDLNSSFPVPAPGVPHLENYNTESYPINIPTTTTSIRESDELPRKSKKRLRSSTRTSGVDGFRRLKRLRKIYRCCKCMKTFSNFDKLLEHEKTHGEEEDNNADNLTDTEERSNWSGNDTDEEFTLGEEENADNLFIPLNNNHHQNYNLTCTTPTTGTTQTVWNGQEEFPHSQLNNVNLWNVNIGSYSNDSVPIVQNVLIDDPTAEVKCEAEPMRTVPPPPPEPERSAASGWQNEETTNPKPLKFKCNICSKEYSTNPRLFKHYNFTHHGRKFKCNLCGKKFKTKSSYEKHNEWSSKNKRYNCDVRELGTEQSKSAKRTGTNGRMNPASTMSPLLPKILRSNAKNLQVAPTQNTVNDYFYNMRGSSTSDNGAKIKCKYCRKRFQSMVEMRNHVTLVHFSKSVAHVLVSGKVAVQYSPIVMAPLQPGVGDAQLFKENRKCGHCFLEFSSNWSYQYHYKSAHEGVSFRCHECSKVFGERENLIEHQMTTTCKLEPDPCRMIDQTFIVKVEKEDKDLQQSPVHVVTISTLDHVCHICGVDFGCKTSLIEHLSTFHPDSSLDLLEMFPPSPPLLVEQFDLMEDVHEDIEVADSPQNESSNQHEEGQISDKGQCHSTTPDVEIMEIESSDFSDSDYLPDQEVLDVPVYDKKKKLKKSKTGDMPASHSTHILTPTVLSTMSIDDPDNKCKHCDEKFQTKHEQNIHVTLHHLSKVTGQFLIPGKVAVLNSPIFSNPPRPPKETGILPKGAKNRKCRHCSEKYASYWAYQYHYKSVHMGVTYRCRECNRVFTQKGNLLQHQMRSCCKPKRKPSTELIDKENLQLSTLEVTTTGASQWRVHLCEICGMGFGVRTGLAEHHRSVHPDYETEPLPEQIKVAFNISFPKIK